MKRLIIGALAIGSITAISIDTYNTYQDNQLTKRIMQSKYNPKRMIQVKQDELKRQQEYEESIQNKRLEIVDYIGSNEYKLKEDTRHWRLPLGITVDQLQPIKMEISYYSDLVIENSKYGNVTASGKTLAPGMIANNHLKFGTNVYIEGEGMKVVEDTGSPKYFGTIAACDVFVPRQHGENDSQYYRRVNSMGRHYKQGYIIKE